MNYKLLEDWKEQDPDIPADGSYKQPFTLSKPTYTNPFAAATKPIPKSGNKGEESDEAYSEDEDH